MGVLDYIIVIVPIIFVLLAAWYTKRYVKGVADFLAAGRVAGRYIISVADLANGLAIISLVAYVEEHYRTGFSLAFWNNVLMPLGLFLGMTGYCTYRFRETRALSIGQFLEMRYSKNFRIFAAALRSLTEVCSNMIMPAIAARFFIYFLDLPHTVNICGYQISTFILVVFIVLTLAISIIWMGGTLALLVTDSLQGMLCYPLLFCFVLFVLFKFSWSTEIVEVMKDRVPGESFINPYDLENFRDFNLFSLCVAVFVSIFHRASWLGAGNSSAARSPHEQMAGVLGGWRSALTTMFYVLIAVCVLTVMNHKNYSKDAKIIRTEVSNRIAGELIKDNAQRERVVKKIAALPEQKHRVGVDAPMSEKSNQDTPYLDAAKSELKGTPEGNAKFQQFRTLFNQMMMAGTMRHLLPPVMLGLFCLLMVLAMISTDDTRIFSSSITISQDVILPLIKKPITPEQHLLMIKLVSLGVGIIFLCGSFFMAQLDYIKLFVTVVCSMWMGGCGPVMIFGMYSRFGNTKGAWTSLLTGMFLGLFCIYLQRRWAIDIYPFLENHGMVERVGNVLTTISRPFNPYIVWEMNPVTCPINSYELSFITTVITMGLYCLVSYLTGRGKEKFNLDRMLHRGIYAEGEKPQKMKWSFKNVISQLVGITPEYTRGDKFIAWGIFSYSFIYQFGILFLLVLVWNIFDRWSNAWWSNYFLVTALIIPGIIALITTFWFGIGGIRDMIRLFRDLRARDYVDPLDDGRVDGDISLADRKKFAELDKNKNSISK